MELESIRPVLRLPFGDAPVKAVRQAEIAAAGVPGFEVRG